MTVRSTTMPTWKGWSEQEVRGKQPNADSTSLPESEHIPSMAGFTAINAPVAPKTTQADVAEGGRELSGRNPSDSVLVPNEASKTIVSDYLGRGYPIRAETAIKPSAGPLHGPGTKKSAAKGKKRPNGAESQSDPKRRKISDVSAGMPVMKSVSKSKQISTAKSKDADVQNTPKTSKGCARDKTEEQTSETVTNESVCISEEPQKDLTTPNGTATSVSVFASTTLMNLFHSSSPQTSLEAVRSSAGHSATVFQRRKTRDSPFAGFPVTQSLLKSVHEPQRADDGCGASTRVLRPRNANVPHATSLARSDGHDRIGSDAKVPSAQVSMVKKQSQISHNSSKPCAKKVSAKDTLCSSMYEGNKVGEDFIGEDEGGLLAALDHVGTWETEVTLPPNPRPPPTSTKQLPTSPNPGEPRSTLADKSTTNRCNSTTIITPEEEFMHLCDEDEAELEELATTAEGNAAARRPSPPLPHRDKKLNVQQVDPHEDQYGGALLADFEKQLLDQIKTSREQIIKPILRKPFPNPILDRSPLFGATNSTTLRTCFRLGEALNVGSHAVRTNSNIVLELYAHVTNSYHEGRTQHFAFKDLYHDHPPYLHGTSELWSQSRLWELDGKAFLDAKEGDGGVMCRAIGKMKRDEEGVSKGNGGAKWRLEIWSIWEAGWQDVEFVAGIYAKDDGFAEGRTGVVVEGRYMSDDIVC